MNIGSLYMELRAGSARLLSDIETQAKAAGAKGGKAASTSFSSEMKRGLSQGIGIGAGLGIADGISAVTGEFFDAVKGAIAYEKALANVNSISHFTDEQLAEVSAAVTDLSNEFGQSAQSLADGMYDIASSGFAGAEALDVLEAATKAATAGLSTTKDAASGITAVLNAYHLSADDAAHVSDVLFETVNRGVVDFSTLSAQIGKTTALAAPLGVRLEEVAAAAALMTRNGIGAEDTFTQINAVMNSMLQPSAEAARLADQLGLGWDAASLKANGLVGQVQQLVDKTRGSEEAMATLLGDSRAIRGAFVLAANAGADLTDELEQFNDVSGATDDTLAVQMESTAFQLQQMQTQLDNATREIADDFLPILVTLAGIIVDDVVPAIQAVSTVLDFMSGDFDKAAKGAGNLGDVMRDNLVTDLLSAAAGLGGVNAYMDKLKEKEEELRLANEKSLFGKVKDDLIVVKDKLDKVSDSADDYATSVENANRRVRTATTKTRDVVIGVLNTLVEQYYGGIARQEDLLATRQELAGLRRKASLGKLTDEEKTRMLELQRTMDETLIDMATKGETKTAVFRQAMDELLARQKTAHGEERKYVDALIVRLQYLIGVTNTGTRKLIKLNAAGDRVVVDNNGQPREHRAAGGHVRAGREYWVNENTPDSEVWRPDISGTVFPASSAVPTDPGRGAYTDNTTINIERLDRDTMPDFIRRQRRVNDVKRMRVIAG